MCSLRKSRTLAANSRAVRLLALPDLSRDAGVIETLLQGEVLRDIDGYLALEERCTSGSSVLLLSRQDGPAIVMDFTLNRVSAESEQQLLAEAIPSTQLDRLRYLGVVGYVYASQHWARAAYRRAVDVTVYVAEGQRRNGVGRQLYDALLPFLKLLRYRSAYAGITLPNDSGVGPHERLGFQHIGTSPQVGFKLDAWYDVTYWRFDLGGDDLRPEDPARFQATC